MTDPPLFFFVFFLFYMPDDKYFALDSIQPDLQDGYILVVEPLKKLPPNNTYATMQDCFVELEGTTSLNFLDDDSLFQQVDAATTSLVPQMSFILQDKGKYKMSKAVALLTDLKYPHLQSLSFEEE